MKEPSYTYRAKLAPPKRGRHPVHDGDSMRIIVDYGFGGSLDLGMCRLFGIDTPELSGTDKLDGQSARDYVRGRMEKHDTFIVETIKDTKGKFGRWLVKVWLDGVCLNDELVAVGHAVPADY